MARGEALSKRRSPRFACSGMRAARKDCTDTNQSAAADDTGPQRRLPEGARVAPAPPAAGRRSLRGSRTAHDRQ